MSEFISKIKELGIKESICKIKDRAFVYNLTKTMLFPYIPLHATVTKEEFDADFSRRYKEIKILQKGKTRIGFYHISPDTKETRALYVSRIFLSKRYQNKKIGYLLMKRFEQLGYSKMKLSVWKKNPALGFYKKLGYRIVSDDKGKCLMEKIL